MAISFVGSAEGVAADGGNATIDLTEITGLAENDLVIVAYGIATTAGDFDMAMVTAGYTEIADLFANDTRDANLGVFRKFMGATPDTSAVVTGNGDTGSSTAAVAMAFRGVDLTTPMDVAATTATDINSPHPDPPSIDHANPSGVWTVLAAANSHAAGGAATYTFPTGYTTNALEASVDDTHDTTCGLAYNTSPADPEDPGALVHSGGDNNQLSWCAVTMALRPAAEGGQTLTPDAVAATLSVPAPTIQLGAVTITPSAVTAALSVPAPSVQLGGLTLTPDAVSAAFAVNAPTVQLGGVTLTPEAVAAALTVPAPLIDQGEQVLTPSAVTALFSIPNPTIIKGAVILTPDAVQAALAVPAPSVLRGAVILEVDPVTFSAAVADPTVTVGGVVVTPNAVVATFLVPAPLVEGGEGGTTVALYFRYN